jgi:hypothetical protein
MRNLILGVLLGFAALPINQRAVGQDHAPSMEQCVADMRLWSSQMDDYLVAETARIKSGSPDKSQLMGLTMRQLNDRASEMVDCVAVDPSGQVDYKEEASEYNDAYRDRYERYIVRHHLMDQVLKEDEEGLR